MPTAVSRLRRATTTTGLGVIAAAALALTTPTAAAAATPAPSSCSWYSTAEELAVSLEGVNDARAQAIRDSLSALGITAGAPLPSSCPTGNPIPSNATSTPNPAGQQQPPQQQPAGQPPPGQQSAPEAGTNLSEIVAGAGTTTTVSNDQQLQAAVSAAKPGDTITLAAGTYGPVTLTGNGTATAPVTMTGTRGAVIDGGSGSTYAVHIQNASYWQLTGLTVTGGGKGIVTDNAQHILLDSLDVGGSSDEAVHFRDNSSDNTIQRSTIHDTGLKQPQYGEGVYLGSAKSNWTKISGGQPDLSMRNRVLNNTFNKITAENVDVKEETSGALIAGNHFDGSATSGKNYADSIVDVKGYASTVTGNVTTGDSPALKNIIETHVITDPATSGCGNTISGNTVEGFQPAGQLVAVDAKCSKQ